MRISPSFVSPLRLVFFLPESRDATCIGSNSCIIVVEPIYRRSFFFFFPLTARWLRSFRRSFDYFEDKRQLEGNFSLRNFIFLFIFLWNPGKDRNPCSSEWIYSIGDSFFFFTHSLASIIWRIISRIKDSWKIFVM